MTMDWITGRNAEGTGIYSVCTYAGERWRVLDFDNLRKRSIAWRWDQARSFWIRLCNDHNARVVMDLSKRAAGQAPSFVIEPCDPRYVADWQSITRGNKKQAWHENTPSFTKRTVHNKVAAERGQEGNRQANGN